MAGQGLTVQQQVDLIKSTLAHYKDVDKFEAALDYQQYYFIDEVFTTDNYQVQDGTRVEFSVVLDNNGSARHATMWDPRTNHDKKDLFNTGYAEWCFADAEAVWHRQALTMNRGASKIRDELKKEYFGAYASLLNIIESRAVLAPTNSADAINPQGLGYWFGMFSGTNYDGGFLGTTTYFADGSTSTTTGGINASTNPNWRSLAANRTAQLDIGTIDTMRYLLILGGFKTPRNLKQFYSDRNQKKKILSSHADQAAYERLVNAGPDDRNGDLNPFGASGNLTFRGIEWIGIPTLNNDAYKRLFCVDFAYFFPIVHADWWMKADEPMTDRDQRKVITMGIDCQYNYGCDNRRRAGFSLFLPQ